MDGLKKKTSIDCPFQCLNVCKVVFLLICYTLTSWLCSFIMKSGAGVPVIFMISLSWSKSTSLCQGFSERIETVQALSTLKPV